MNSLADIIKEGRIDMALLHVKIEKLIYYL